MSPITPELIFHVVEFIALIGFYYGVVRTKLESIEKIANELIGFRNDSLTRNGASGERDKTTEDKLEKIEDRLDVHAVAIRNLELSNARTGRGD